MSNNDIQNKINENNLTIENNKTKTKKKIKNSLKNNLFQKDNNQELNELNNNSKNNMNQQDDYLNNNLPSISKPKNSENNDLSENSNQNFYSESNINEQNKNVSESKSAKIINERQKNNIYFLKKRFSYKIIVIYKNEDYYITIKPNCKISDLKEIISKEINLEKEKIILIYKDKEMDENNRNIPINKFINFTKLKSRPIIYVKKKYVNNINL